MSGWLRAAALLILAMTALAQAEDTPLSLALPTDNTALLRGDKAEFYQVIERNLNGAVSYPWEGGNTASYAIRSSWRARRFTPVSTRGWTFARCAATGRANRSTKCARWRTARSFIRIGKLALQTTVAMWWSSIAGEAALTTVSTRISTRSRSRLGNGSDRERSSPSWDIRGRH